MLRSCRARPVSGLEATFSGFLDWNATSVTKSGLAATSRADSVGFGVRRYQCRTAIGDERDVVTLLCEDSDHVEQV